MRITMNKEWKVVLTTVFCFLVGFAVAAPLAAQEKFGSFNGVVMDETGGVLPGVMVTITNLETNRTLSAITGGDGTYFGRNLDPGNYSLRFDLPGFLATVYPSIPLNVGKTLKVDPKLK